MHQKVRGPDLDVSKLVRRFNGAAELQRRLTKAGYTIKLKTIQMWVHRARVPADWLPVLLVLAEQEGKPLRLDQYVKAQKQPAKQAIGHPRGQGKSKTVDKGASQTAKDMGFLE